MKKFLFVFGLVFLGTSAFAQQPAAPRPTPQRQIITSTEAIRVPMPGPVDVDIREQSDSPIRLTVDEASKGRIPGTPLKARNDSGSTVAAYVLRVDVEPYGFNQMVVFGPKGLAAGEVRIQGLAPWNNREGSSARQALSVDYVQFGDGTSWGENSLGRSKDVAAFLKGRNEAVARIQEMLAGQDATDVNRAFDVYSSSSFSEPNLTPGRPPRYVDYYVRGYEEVINILRHMPRNAELGKDLANRLETMSKRSDQ